jgi:chromosome segregation ATPase
MSKEERMDKLVNNQFQIKNSENTRLIVGWIKSMEDSKTEIQENFKENTSSLENSIEKTLDRLNRLEENDVKKVNELSRISKELDKIKSDQKEKFEEIYRNRQHLEDRILKLETNLNTLVYELKSSIDGLKQENDSKLRELQEALVKLNTKFESPEENLRKDLSDSENKLKSDFDAKLEKSKKKLNLNETIEGSSSKMNTLNDEPSEIKTSTEINPQLYDQEHKGGRICPCNLI